MRRTSPSWNKMIGDDDRDEELEEAFDPEVDDPEPPHVHDGVSWSWRRRTWPAGRRTGIAKAAIQEEGDERLVAPGRSVPASTARQTSQNQNTRPEREQDLPEPPDVEVFPALVAEPEPAVRRAGCRCRAHSPSRLPTTTTTIAPEQDVNERPLTRRVAHRQAPMRRTARRQRTTVAIQKIISCRCHVRSRLLGNQADRSKP